MHQRLPLSTVPERVRPTPLLILWTWTALTLGLGYAALSHSKAQAADLIIPADTPATPATRPAPVQKPAARTAPPPVRKPVIQKPVVPKKPVVRTDPSVRKPVVRSAPPLVSQPKPVVQNVQKAPASKPPQGGAPAPSSEGTRPAAPVIQTPVAPISKPIGVPSRASAPIKDRLIDASKNYDLGATQPRYVKPSRVVVSERRSGCQMVVSQRSIASSICGRGVAPTVQVRSARRSVASKRRVLPLSQRQAYPVRQSSVVSRLPRQQRLLAGNTSRGLTPATAPTFSATPYQQSQQPSQSYKGPNPLKWLLSDGKRMMFPVAIPAQITSAFGWRIHPISGQRSFHSGTDIAAPMGTPVVAAYEGEVAIADYLGGYGLSVLLHHQEGERATRYAHLSEIFVQPGQLVEQGTVVGLVGSTGYSTGPHLHFETLEKTPQGYVLVDSGLEIKLALSVLVEATKLAQASTTPLESGKAQLNTEAPVKLLDEGMTYIQG